MRGSPLLHCIICAFAFALFAVPLARLTFARPQPSLASKVNNAEKVSAPDAATKTLIRIRCAHAPKSLSLKLGDRELLPTPVSQLPSPIETSVSIPIPKDGLELALAAQWPEGTPDTAVTVELEPDELDSRRETRWSVGNALSEILSFKW